MKNIFTDGSGWSGTRSGYAIVPGDGTPKVVWEPVERTNNEREYDAIIQALTEFTEPGDKILSDSQLCVNQILGKWRCNSTHLLGLQAQAQALLIERQCSIHWVPREQNLAGHILEQKPKS